MIDPVISTFNAIGSLKNIYLICLLLPESDLII